MIAESSKKQMEYFAVIMVTLTSREAAEEGMTIRQYLIKERCIHAANLLKYSDYDLSTIAEYFCFSSQSHFGNQFKKVMGMTPKEYRTRYKNTSVYIPEEDKK
ncbi:MAG: helix-turn-helix transcriptional regulator [Lachnospiraceae bacterium]|nr:helix-turn-helix transcriptional regulator [Lachnospiraceae bacterium]